MRCVAMVGAMGVLALSAPAMAEVAASSDGGFVVTHSVTLAGADAARVWEGLVHPELWWSSAHSWSGNSANLSLDPVASGCFCEVIPAALPGGAVGSVEHMQVIHVRPQARLVMRGALGPLQGEALTGVLTIVLEPGEEAGSTDMAWTYVVGGYARFPLPAIAPAVDGVVAEQMARLQARVAGG
jgi:hypothetical protein